MMLDMIKDPWSLAIIVSVIFFTGILYFMGKKKQAIQMACHLIHVAEVMFGPQKGNEKHWYVVEELYPKLPKIIKIVYSKDEINDFVIHVFRTTEYYLKEKM